MYFLDWSISFALYQLRWQITNSSGFIILHFLVACLLSRLWAPRSLVVLLVLLCLVYFLQYILVSMILKNVLPTLPELLFPVLSILVLLHSSGLGRKFCFVFFEILYSFCSCSIAFVCLFYLQVSLIFSYFYILPLVDLCISIIFALFLM